MNTKNEERITELKKLIANSNRIIRNLSYDAGDSYTDDFSLRVNEELEMMIYQRDRYLKELEELESE